MLTYEYAAAIKITFDKSAFNAAFYLLYELGPKTGVPLPLRHEIINAMDRKTWVKNSGERVLYLSPKEELLADPKFLHRVLPGIENIELVLAQANNALRQEGVILLCGEDVGREMMSQIIHNSRAII